MDRATAIKLLAGTIARGILWASALLAAKYGAEKITEDTATGLATFAAGIIVAAISTWWSAKKNTRLLETIPPEESPRR